MDKKPLPIGVEDFRILREDEYYYIDKTFLIKDLLDQKGSVNLFLRPRRFGKTLNLSMLKYYFEKPINSEQDNSYLFEDTLIWGAGEKYIKEFAKYPVISMSLKNATQLNFESMYEELKKIISKEYKRHEYLLESEKLSDQDKKEFKQIMILETNSKTDYKNSLLKLTDLLYQHYNQRVIIIIDEYDAPFQKAFVNGFYKEAIDFIASFLGNAMKTNEHMQFGIMTGCMRILKESVFTGFNNLIVNSILTPNYSEMFGFTQNEVDEVLAYYEVSQKRDLIKEWYNGYKFSQTWVYNPWSLINYVKVLNTDLSMAPIPYWGNTSGNDLIKDLIINSDGKTKDTLEKLIKGESVELILNEGIIYDDLITSSDEKILNLFFFSGYLTQTDFKSVNDDVVYTIKIPNKEVRKVYERIVDEWFKEKIQSVNLEELYSKIFNGDYKGFEDLINEILMDSVSFWDNNEQYYHGFMLSLMQQAKGYKVISNRESGTGRFDLAMYHRISRKKPAVIMEFKVLKKDNPFIMLEDVCQDALKQIENKKYYQDLKSVGYEKIFKYGIAFDGKICAVSVRV